MPTTATIVIQAGHRRLMPSTIHTIATARHHRDDNLVTAIVIGQIPRCGVADRLAARCPAPGPFGWSGRVRCGGGRVGRRPARASSRGRRRTGVRIRHPVPRTHPPVRPASARRTGRSRRRSAIRRPVRPRTPTVRSNSIARHPTTSCSRTMCVHDQRDTAGRHQFAGPGRHRNSSKSASRRRPGSVTTRSSRRRNSRGSRRTMRSKASSAAARRRRPVRRTKWCSRTSASEGWVDAITSPHSATPGCGRPASRVGDPATSRRSAAGTGRRDAVAEAAFQRHGRRGQRPRPVAQWLRSTPRPTSRRRPAGWSAAPGRRSGTRTRHGAALRRPPTPPTLTAQRRNFGRSSGKLFQKCARTASA